MTIGNVLSKVFPREERFEASSRRQPVSEGEGRRILSTHRSTSVDKTLATGVSIAAPFGTMPQEYGPSTLSVKIFCLTSIL